MLSDPTWDDESTCRSEAWHQVWDRRDPDKLRYDGSEGRFRTEDDRERWRNAQVAFISDTLNLSPDDHLLDLGCGTGALTIRLVPLVRHVTAVDYSADAVASARRMMRTFGETVEVVHANLAKFDYTSAPFTKAVAVSSLHYLDNYAVLHRIVATLSQQGSAVLIMDLPDAALAEQVTRPYDRRRWSHLAVDPEHLKADFPGSLVHRGMLPWYDNDAVRFSICVPPSVVPRHRVGKPFGTTSP